MTLPQTRKNMWLYRNYFSNLSIMKNYVIRVYSLIGQDWLIMYKKSIKNTTQSTVEVFKIKLDNELDSLSDSMATNNNERTMAESNSIS